MFRQIGYWMLDMQNTVTHQHRASSIQTPATWRRSIGRRLLTWYSRHARDLPWRRTGDPYAIWVSEIMLQQTQVATVEGYFERFIDRFPDIRSLARADEQQVLRMWEGLGYYRRARLMHQAARVLVAEHGATFPRDIQTVRSLPGIGRYTAGAILSIAFDDRHPVLEANSIRLLTRLLAFVDDPETADSRRQLWAAASQLLPQKQVGHFNQATMELGSQVCTPRKPNCPACPLRELCATHSVGMQDRIPMAKQKTPYEAVREAVVVVRRSGKVLILRCPPGERWAGLWDFPRFTMRAQRPGAVERELQRKCLKMTGCEIIPRDRFTTIKHTVTRYRITLDCYHAHYLRGAGQRSPARPMQWIKPAEFEEIPLSVTGRKISRLLL